jgi:hypothetical protein
MVENGSAGLLPPPQTGRLMARKAPPGRKVRRPGGYFDFVPDPLPLALDWTADLVARLSEADRQID